MLILSHLISPPPFFFFFFFFIFSFFLKKIYVCFVCMFGLGMWRREVCINILLLLLTVYKNVFFALFYFFVLFCFVFVFVCLFVYLFVLLLIYWLGLLPFALSYLIAPNKAGLSTCGCISLVSRALRLLTCLYLRNVATFPVWSITRIADL